MSLSYQGLSFADISTGKIDTIKVRQQGVGTLTDVGAMSGASCRIEPITKKGEGGTDVVQAVRCSVAFVMKQSKTSAEIATMAGTSGTGLFDTDVECEITFANGRKITFGTVSGYPFRLVPAFNSGGEEDAQQIPVTGTNIELYSSVGAKFS